MALIRSRRPSRLAFQPFAAVPTFDDIENRMRKMMDDMFTEADLSTPIGWVPAIEITETEKEMVVSAELPGLEKKDVELSVEGDRLTIAGEKTEERTEDEKKYHLWERNYGSFRRSFSLPRGVDTARISADFKHGVLKIRLPKTAEAQAKGRKIDISVT
jgi:HSP20 family protein